MPAHEIAEALLALDRVVRRSPAVFRRLVPGVSAPKVELLVTRLEAGSLTEDIVVKLFFGSQKKMDQAIKAFKEGLGVDLTSKSGVVRTVVLGLLLVGGYYAIQHSGTPAKPTVEISHNTIIHVGAKELNMPPEALVKIIETAVQNKDRLASDAVAIIRPAKRDPKAEIVVDGKQELSISNKIVIQVPSEFEPDRSEKITTIAHAEIHLRALDLDSSDHGWAAVIPGVSERRLPLEIAEAINGDDLFGEKIVHGTVEVISRRDPYGRMQLRGYRLVALDLAK